MSFKRKQLVVLKEGKQTIKNKRKSGVGGLPPPHPNPHSPKEQNPNLQGVSSTFGESKPLFSHLACKANNDSRKISKLLGLNRLEEGA